MQTVLQGTDRCRPLSRQARPAGARGIRRLRLGGSQGFDLAHRQPLGHDAPGDPFGIAQSQERAGVTRGDFPRAQAILHRLGQVEEA